MKPYFPLRVALSDPHILGGIIDGPSWARWRALLIGAMGEPLDNAERALFKEITGRDAEPAQRVEELWAIFGRRAGKTRCMAVLSAYISACCDWSNVLAPGEVGVVALFAATVRQAEIALSYVSAVFNDRDRPLFHQLLQSETQEIVELTNQTMIEVRPASFKTSRGISAIAIVADEIAFWSSGDNSANPDAEILNALRPSLGTTGGPLIAISSPHARRGELWNTYRDHFGPTGDPAILVANASSRTMNPTLPQAIVDRAMQRDAAVARAEFGGEFRTDVEGFVSLNTITLAVKVGRLSLPPDWLKHAYFGFLDAAAGSGTDSMTMAVAHIEGNHIVLDLVEELSPPFSPETAAESFAEIFKSYRITTVTSDKWALGWVTSVFRQHGITVETSAEPKSTIYATLLPLLNAGRVDLLDIPRLRSQLLALERKVNPSGKDTIDHPRGGHDDVINAAAGAIVMAANKLDNGFDWGSDAFREGMDQFAFALGLQ